MAGPELELIGVGGGRGLFCLPSRFFFPFLISSFLPKMGGGGLFSFFSVVICSVVGFWLLNQVLFFSAFYCSLETSERFG